MDRVVKVMSQKAITVLRNGRYFGDAVDGLQPDWFIRIVKPAGHEGNLSLHLKALLDLQDGQPEPAAESAVQLRSRLLIGELVASRSRELQAQREIAGLRHKLANIAIPPEPGGDIASYPADLSYIGVRGDEVVEEEIEETADTAPLSGLSYPLIFSNI